MLLNLDMYNIEDLNNKLTVGDLEEPGMYFDGGVFKNK